MTILIYAASVAVLVWAFWPAMARKWRETRFKWETVKDAGLNDCRPRWDEFGLPVDTHCEYGLLGETNINYGRDAETTGPR